MQEKKSKKKKQLNSYIQFSSLVSQMAIIIIAGVFFGDFLDKNYQSETPIYTIIFSLLSLKIPDHAFGSLFAILVISQRLPLEYIQGVSLFKSCWFVIFDNTKDNMCGE